MKVAEPTPIEIRHRTFRELDAIGERLPEVARRLCLGEERPHRASARAELNRLANELGRLNSVVDDDAFK